MRLPFSPNMFKFALLWLIFGVFFGLNIRYGSVSIPFGEVWAHLLGQSANTQSPFYQIIWNIRLPDALQTALAGAGLSVSGLWMQTFFRNPIAGSYILGISSGASLGIAVALLAFPAFLGVFGMWGASISAFAGAALMLGLVLWINYRLPDKNTLLLVGVLLGTGISAGVELLQFFAPPDKLQQYVLWTMGSLAGAVWAEVILLGGLVIGALIAGYLLSSGLNLLLLGDDYASSSGLALRRFKTYLILLTALLSGSITAFCGLIALVGTAVPQLARWMFSTSQHQILTPACGLLGACMLLICAYLCKLPFADQALPINAVTSILFAPVIVWILLKQKSGKV